MEEKNSRSGCPTPIALATALTIATFVFALIYLSGKFILQDAPLAFILALVISCSCLEATLWWFRTN
jgi:hypothetical protein